MTAINPKPLIDYSKPHEFELEVGRITRVCKCGELQGRPIHSTEVARAAQHFTPAPYSKTVNQCLQKATDDMPLFVLKPTDQFAIHIIEDWYIRARTAGVNKDKLADVLELRNAMQKWREAHPDRVKIPD